MIFDASSAALVMTAFLLLWLIPLAAFLLSTRLHGLQRVNWALLLAVLSWPAFALYLFFEGIRKART